MTPRDLDEQSSYQLFYFYSQFQRPIAISKDGPMRFSDNNPANPEAFYESNSFESPAEAQSYRELPLKISGDADPYNHRDGNDNYGQPRALFLLFDEGKRQRLFSNIA